MRDQKHFVTKTGFVFQMNDPKGVVRKFHYSGGQLHYSSVFKRRVLVKNVSAVDSERLIPLLERIRQAHLAADMDSVGAISLLLHAEIAAFPLPREPRRKIQVAPFYGTQRFLGMFCTPHFSMEVLEPHVGCCEKEYFDLLAEKRTAAAEIFRASMCGVMIWTVAKHAIMNVLRAAFIFK